MVRLHNLDNLGMSHFTVNHSLYFKDPNTGVFTNTAEVCNSGLKRFVPIRNRVRDGIDMHLSEYIWRRKKKYDLFNSFLKCIKDTL